MKIAILGYGKMGRVIEKILLERGHTVTLKATSKGFLQEELNGTDVAIEFSTPENAIENITKCFNANVPVIVGTTGWYDRFSEIETLCKETNGALFYATNFSIGVNLFFKLNKQLAALMNNFPDYKVAMQEIHHIQKLDAPSGTAITLAEGLIGELEEKNNWKNELTNDNTTVGIVSKREREVPGTHNIVYESEVDAIEIIHTAKNRKGFALGSVIAAEWLKDKKGIFNMNDLLNL